MNSTPDLPAYNPHEIEQLERRIHALEAALARSQSAEEQLRRLATFPAQNPNLVIETSATGEVSYLNPVAEARFPDLWAIGADHPLLRDLAAIATLLREGVREYVARELDIGEAVFEQKICLTDETAVSGLRIFAHDITARKRAEESIQKLAQKVVTAQEEERQRVSRELHDEAGQALTALKISLEIIQRDLPPEPALQENFSEAIAVTERTRERIRLLARGLRPPALDTLGLNLTLEDYCRDFTRRTQLKITYQGTELPTLPNLVAIGAYRLLQEALTNVARHAAATQVDVTLLQGEGEICLRVVDNGCGFQTKVGESRSESGGLGLLGMEERIELLGGEFRIVSSPGAGTLLEAHLPWTAGP